MFEKIIKTLWLQNRFFLQFLENLLNNSFPNFFAFFFFFFFFFFFENYRKFSKIFKKGAFYFQPLGTNGCHYETTENSD